ncbi:hypothetical protein Dimus_012942 [Dionaea muscipula]
MSSGGSRVNDPSKLQLKKELTQIRKAARMLRDPGTSSCTWKSPLNSARSAPHSAFQSHQSGVLRRQFSTSSNRNDDDNGDHTNPPHPENPRELLPRAQGVRSSRNRDIGNDGEKNNDGRVKEKRVLLYNWRSNSNKSSSEKSLRRLDGLDGDSNDIGPSVSAAASASFDGSMSDARNEDWDSKSDCHVDDHLGGHCYSGVFHCRRDTKLGSLASSMKIRRARSTMKSKKVSPYNFKHKRNNRRWVIAGRNSMNYGSLSKGVSSRSLVMMGQSDSVSLVDQSDGMDGCYNSEDLEQASAVSPVLSGVRRTKFPPSSIKFLRGSPTEDSSYSQSTPALSMSSYNRYFHRRNPSIVGSWDGTIASSLEMEDEADDRLDLPARQGCGIPCYWPKRSTKHREACGSCCSPSLSKTLRRQGCGLLCGSQKVCDKHHFPSSYSDKQMIVFGAAQGHKPLLDHTHDEGCSSLGARNSDDETSIEFGELNLEGLSSLDWRKWSSLCKSHERFELATLGEDVEGESLSENNRSLSQRYRPMFFDELVGQHVVVQSLMNAITKGRIAPVYLFHGPRGTGKTSTAKVFAAALNCLASEGTKPCGICKECTEFISGKSKDIEVDGTSKKESERVKYLLKSLSIGLSSNFTGYKVFVIDECHLLPSKTWLAFLKILDEPLPRVVFILITANLDNVPCTVMSRCQKYLFNKIRDGDILRRLHKISIEENLDIESDALELIAQNADGSLRDAETMLDQLSLLGKRITSSLVNELVGIVSDEKLLELLEFAMASNTAETVKRARELLDSGVDPLALMSQLASLIMDIIAGAYRLNDAQSGNAGRSLTDGEMEKLKHALKLLSEAEKQLRISSERSTWFTATLLQLGSVSSPDFTLSGSSRRLSSKTSDEYPSTESGGAVQVEKSEAAQMLHRKTALLSKKDQQNLSSSTHDTLDNLWLLCIERCHSKTLRQLLLTHGKLVSLSEVDGVLVACIAFRDEAIKSRAEGFIISITNSIETVLRRNVVLRIVLFPNGMNSTSAEPTGSLYGEEKIGSKSILDTTDAHHEPLEVSRKCLNAIEDQLIVSQKVGRSSLKEEIMPGIPLQRTESLICQARLETAWLQAAEKGTPRSTGRLRPEKNQVLPQEGGINSRKQLESVSSMDSCHQDDALNHEIKILKVDKKTVEKDYLTDKGTDSHHISPSLLHQISFSGNISKDFLGYESGTGTGGCNMFFCWCIKPQKRGKVGQQTSVVRLKKDQTFLCFGKCRKSRRRQMTSLTTNK